VKEGVTFLATHEKRYVIIGNGVAGTTAAETLRKNDPNCSIHLLTNERYPLYNRVSLPRFLQGVIVEQKVMIRDFVWHEQRNIELITETIVTHVNTEEQVVHTEDGRAFPYDALLVASGGWANPLNVPGASDTKHIYNFVTLDDTKTLVERMLDSRTALAYGGSFIAYELCDGFAMRKLDTVWMMRGPYWLRNSLDTDGGEVVDAIAKKFGVEVIHGDEIASVVPSNGVPSYVKTVKGREIQTDMIGVGLGITLNTQILEGSPIEVNGGVVVNEYLETNVAGIYAAGDVANFYDATTKSHHTMGTWDNAKSHGQVAAVNMAGGHQAYVDVPTYTSPLFDVNIAVVGSAESNNPEMETIALREPGEKGNENYRRLFFLENKLVGVLMVGSPKGRKKLVELVKNQQIFATASEREAILRLK
jgi:NAD(P)H-nitrite reductase large subunit